MRETAKPEIKIYTHDKIKVLFSLTSDINTLPKVHTDKMSTFVAGCHKSLRERHGEGLLWANDFARRRTQQKLATVSATNERSSIDGLLWRSDSRL